MENIPSREGEVWKPIEGFPSYYFSNLNRVYKVSDRNIKIREGKKIYCLFIEGKNTPVKISWLYKNHFPYEWINLLQEGEEVKPLKEYPGYFITSRGRVWSMWGYKFLTPNPTQEYYYKLTLGRGKTPTLHTLVGRNFLPEYKEGLYILHKEEGLSYPEINYVENLWVGTLSDNQQDRRNKGR